MMRKHPWLTIIAGCLVGSLTVVPLAFSQPQTPAYQGQNASFANLTSSTYLMTSGAVPSPLSGSADTYLGSYDSSTSGLWCVQNGVAPTTTNYAVVCNSTDCFFVGNAFSVNYSTKAATFGGDITIPNLGKVGPTSSSYIQFNTTNFGIVSNGAQVFNSERTTGTQTYHGSGLTAGYVQGILNTNTTAVATAGTCVTPDDLQTYTLPASTLTTTNRCIKIIAYGTQANNTNPKSIQLAIGPTPTALITKQLQQTAVGAGDTWKIEAIICRTSASNQDYIAEATNYGGTTISVVDGPTVLSEDVIGVLTQTETNALDIKLRGTVCTTNGDITSELLMVEAL